MSTTPLPFCQTNPECDRRLGVIEARVGVVEQRQQVQGESIAALRAQVFAWSAFGALAGGALVAVFGRVVLR